jgi:AMP nucleosidase
MGEGDSGERHVKQTEINALVKLMTKMKLLITGSQIWKSIETFGKYFLLTNYVYYVDLFAKWHGVKAEGKDKNMPSATADGITIISFGMGSPNAATVMDLLSAVSPSAVLFLGKCGGLKKKNTLGDLILPIAAIRSDGTSNDYLPLEVPALPAFKLQSAISAAITRHNKEYWTGTVYTTNRRVWEYDDRFKKYLVKTRAMAIDMETATIFTVGFANETDRGIIAGFRSTYDLSGYQN